ncbi:YbaB/EbfC family nucleoid-associated protein [Nocardia carnea]|uniref:YbaB/EbfC family nucleoid-associated protein n=1 Tax=Nocardia carnea TaxID=37328 RepID=UPI0024547E82|nr:YbaB/EbfC family nucleoid-associated protein [Nocardia carnea]
MTNEQAKADFAAIMGGVREQMRTIARIQQQRAEITATGTARGKKIRVTVNADNAVIDVKFADDIDELSYSEIAKAIVEAAQSACKEIAEKTSDLMAPLEMQKARMPKLSELVEGMEEMEIPGVVPASTARPTAVERRDISDGRPRPGGAVGGKINAAASSAASSPSDDRYISFVYSISVPVPYAESPSWRK